MCTRYSASSFAFASLAKMFWKSAAVQLSNSTLGRILTPPPPERTSDTQPESKGHGEKAQTRAVAIKILQCETKLLSRHYSRPCNCNVLINQGIHYVGSSSYSQNFTPPPYQSGNETSTVHYSSSLSVLE